MNIDYDDIECPSCGSVGVVPDGDFDYTCLSCDYEGTLMGRARNYVRLSRKGNINETANTRG